MSPCARRRFPLALVATLSVFAATALWGGSGSAAAGTARPAVTGALVGGDGVQLSGVACPTTSACWVVGDQAGATPPAVVFATRDTGHRWRRQSITPTAALGLAGTATLSLSAVSCADTRHCLAVGSVTQPLPGGAVAVTADGGRTWGAGLGPPGDTALVAVQCSAPGTCVVLAVTGTDTFSATTTDGGATWQRGGTLPAGFDGASSLSCPTALTCAVAGYTATSPGHGVGVIAVTHDGGMTWSLATVPANTGVLHAVSCDTTGCLAVGSSSTVITGVPSGTGAVLASADGGATFTTRPASPALDDGLGVDCAPPAGRGAPPVCAAVGIAFTHAIPPVPLSSVVATANPGGYVLPLAARYVPSPLVAVTCPTAVRCVAAGGPVAATVTLPASAAIRPPPAPHHHKAPRAPAGHGTTTTG